MKRVLLPLMTCLLAACSSPTGQSSPSSTEPPDFKPGDVIVTTGAQCDQVYQCILGKRPEYQEMFDTVNMFQEDAARVEACNNSLINPLELVPECAPAGTGS